MTEDASKKKKVLFVDDDPELLELLENLFSTWSKGEWEVHTATNTGKALSIIQSHAIELAVIDLNMPVVDGFQFLSLLNRKYPNLTKAVLTGSDDDEYRARCLSNGAELYLTKPVNIEGMELVYSNLNELINLNEGEGFRGVLRKVGLQDVIQLECLGAKSSILEIANRQTRGRIYIRDGRIIHAQEGERSGTKAFNCILSLQGGDFSLKPFVEPPEETIADSWEGLIMEAARVADEGEDEEETLVEAEAEPAEMPWEKDEFKPDFSQGTGDDALKKAAAGFAKEVLQPKVEEMLVCSPEGDVLYEWQCADNEKVIELMEFVSQQSRVLTKSMVALGPLEHLEMAQDDVRSVLSIKSECASLVRTRNSPLRDRNLSFS